MKLIFQFARILVFCFLGELLHAILPLPIPSSVYGLILLLAALKTGIVKLDQVKTVGNFLTGIFLLLFIPGTVAVVEQLELIKSLWLPMLIVLLPITWAVFGAAGKVTDLIAGREKHG